MRNKNSTELLERIESNLGDELFCACKKNYSPLYTLEEIMDSILTTDSLIIVDQNDYLKQTFILSIIDLIDPYRKNKSSKEPRE